MVTGVAVIGSRAFPSPALAYWVAFLPAITAVTTSWSGIHYAWRGIRTVCGRIDDAPRPE
jgi:hypothetical protein